MISSEYLCLHVSIIAHLSKTPTKRSCFKLSQFLSLTGSVQGWAFGQFRQNSSARTKWSRLGFRTTSLAVELKLKLLARPPRRAQPLCGTQMRIKFMCSTAYLRPWSLCAFRAARPAHHLIQSGLLGGCPAPARRGGRRSPRCGASGGRCQGG